jgi:virulence-associated protein VagC
MPSDLDIAQQLKSVMAKIAAKTASSTVATTTIESGTATSNSADSTDGKTVEVILDAATVVTGEDDSQAVTLPTNVEVKTGDTVQVTCTVQGTKVTSQIVTGVTGRGQEQADATAAAQTAADDAKSAATTLSTLIRESSDGVDVGKSSDGSTYSTSVARVGSDGAFHILTSALVEVAKYAGTLIELGKNSESSILKFCGGKGTAKFENSTMYFQAESGGMVALASRSTANPLIPAKNPGVYAWSDTNGSHLSLCGEKFNVNNDYTDMPAARVGTAIQPVVLYNGGAALNYNTAPGAGTTGTVTLSETAANFSKLKIFYKTDDNEFQSVEVTSPNNKLVSLSINHPWGSGQASAVVLKGTWVAISGTSINVGGYCNIGITTSAVTSYSGNVIYIVRVEGIR